MVQTIVERLLSSTGRTNGSMAVLMFGMNQVPVGLSLAAPAVYIIYNRVRSFAALPVWGIRNTIISIVACSMGARYRNRVRRIIAIAMKTSAIIRVCF